MISKLLEELKNEKNENKQAKKIREINQLIAENFKLEEQNEENTNYMNIGEIFGKQINEISNLEFKTVAWAYTLRHHVYFSLLDEFTIFIQENFDYVMGLEETRIDKLSKEWGFRCNTIVPIKETEAKCNNKYTNKVIVNIVTD